MKRIFLLWAFLLPVMMCTAQSGTADSVLHIDLDTLTVSAPAAPPAYQPSAPRVWDIVNTRIALSFNWKERTAAAKEWITMHPYCYDADTIVLDAKGMKIDSVLLAGKKGSAALSYVYEKDALRIGLGHKYRAGDTVLLHLVYTAMPYAAATGGSDAITDDRGLYFINTDHKTQFKPSEIWTQGETESNSHWMITVDKPNTRFTTQVELTVPDSFVTLSNGAMVKQVKGSGGMHTDIWKMDQPIQAYAVMFAIGQYAVIKDKWRNKEVSYYVEPEFAPYAREIFLNTPAMMEYFSKRTGVPYPWNKYSQVVARDYVSGAMENTSASLFGEFVNQTAREMADRNSEDVVSHELFHQWFGDYVTAESWSNLTVNESFANYGEQLWRGYKYGKAAADELAYNDLQGYVARSAGNDPNLVRFYYDDREQMFDAISYNKGGSILRYLNSLLGDDAFDKAMHIYLTKNALHSAEAHNWRMAVEEATGQDWNWFFNQWYFHGGHPVLKVGYDYNDTTQQLKVTVSQVQDDSTYMYRLPLKAAIIYGNTTSVIDWNIAKRKEVFIYSYKNGVRPLLIPDYTHVLPGELKDTKKPEQWIAQLTHSSDYISKQLAVNAAGKQIADSVFQALLNLAFTDSLPAIRRSAIGQLSRASADRYHKMWTGTVMAIATGDRDTKVRAQAFEILSDWKAAEAKQLMMKAVWDSSYTIAANALEGLDHVDKDSAYLLAKEVVKANPRAALESTIWAILGRKGAGDDAAYFTDRALHVSGNRKIILAYAMTSFLKNVDNDEAFAKVTVSLRDMAMREEVKAFTAAIGKTLFDVAGDLKDKQKSGKEGAAESAVGRLALVRAACDQMVANEDDAATQKDFKKLLKDNFDTPKD